MGEAAVREVGVEDVSGSDEFALTAKVSGSAKMKLLLWSYRTMGYLLPREEVTGKRPV